MMYLEDYLEKLECLPQEIKNYTSKIGQLDQQVKNSMDTIKENVDNLFSNADTMHPDNLDADFKAVMQIGDKVLETSDEKIGLANKMHNIIKRYMSHIDIEIQKFKFDLNIDRSGATELIEKNMEELFNDESSFNDEFIVVDSNSPNKHNIASHLQTDTNISLEDMSGGSAISASAPKVMVSPKKSVKSTRRKSASLKASFEAINCEKTRAESDALSQKLCMSKELPQLGSSNKNKTKKHSKNLKRDITNNFLDMSIDEDNMEPNDHHECFCNEVAYSTTIGCNNSKSVKSTKHKSASLKASFEAINCVKTSAESDALCPELHISEELPQLDSLNKKKTKKRSKNLKRKKTNNFHDISIDVDTIEPNDHREYLCNEVAYFTPIGSDNSKSVKSTRRKSASLEGIFEAINCEKTSAESDALCPELHISEELPQLDSSNKNKTKKRSKNLKRKKTNDFHDMSIDVDNIEPNDHREYLCNEVAYFTPIGSDNSKSVKSTRRKSASLEGFFEAINCEKTSAESDALCPDLHISEELPQLDSLNKKKTKKRSKNLKRKKTNNFHVMSIDEDNIEPNDHRECLCNEVAYSTTIGSDISKSVKSTRRKSASLEAFFDAINCEKTSAESDALCPELHISEELPQLDSSNKNKTKKRSKNLKRKKTNDFHDMSIDVDNIEPNDHREYLCNEVAYFTPIGSDNSKSVKSTRRKSASLEGFFEAINCEKTSAESDALSPELHISEELPQLDSSNKNKTIKRSKNLKEDITNNFLDILIDANDIEPDDRRYCFCNDVAYSTMIGCDNRKCPYEWFHYKCVGIKSKPSGKWYCPQCIMKLKKKRRR